MLNNLTIFLENYSFHRNHKNGLDTQKFHKKKDTDNSQSTRIHKTTYTQNFAP